MSSVKLKVLLFAAAREAVGSNSIELDVPEGSTTTDLLKTHLPAAFPALAPVLETAALARNQEYCDVGEPVPLLSTDEIAIIPPISGG